MLCILLPSYNREVWGLLPIFIRMRHRWLQVSEYDAGSLPESTTILSIWLGMSWICIYIYMYSRHTIIRAYHAYLSSRGLKVSHGDYLGFSFRWYLYYPFTVTVYDFTFRFTYQYIFIRIDVPLPGDAAFYFVRAGTLIDLPARIQVQLWVGKIHLILGLSEDFYFSCTIWV